MGAFAEGAVIYRLNIVTASGGTTVLTVASESWVKVQGSTTETIELPNALTLRAGREFVVVNESTGAVTVNKNGGDLSAEVAPGRQRIFRLFDNTTSAGIWHETDQIDAHGPLTLHATVSTVDSNLNISANQVTSNEGNTQSTPPIDDIINEFSAASIDFQTGAATTGVSLGTFGSITTDGSTFTKPNVTVGQFTRMVLVYQSAANNIDTSFSAAAATQSALTNAGTLFAALDGVPIGFIDLESTAAFDFKTPGAATNVIENSGVTRFGSGSSAGAAGDTSFKLQSISTNVGKIKKGFLILDSGRELVTYDGVDNNVDLDFNLKTAVNSFGVTAPSASTTYYLYLDLSFLPATTVTVGDPQRVAYQAQSGTTGMFTVLASTPENTDLSRYIPLAVIRTDGSSDYTEFEDLARRRHQAPSVNVSPLVGTILDGASIGTIGMVANARGTLQDSFFPNTTDLHFWSLNSDTNDGVVANPAVNLTQNGSPSFVTKGIFGENILRTTGTTSGAYSDDSFFQLDPASEDFSIGIWARVTYNEAGVTPVIFGVGDPGGSSMVQLESQGNLSQVSDNAGLTFSTGDLNSYDLHHWVYTYDSSGGGLTSLYLDGRLVATNAGVLTNVANERFTIGLGRGLTSGGTTDRIFEECFFKKSLLTATEVNGLYSRRFKNFNQLAGGHILTNESFPCTSLTDKVYYWNLSSTSLLTDGSGNGKSLTDLGTATYSGLDLFGAADAYELDGSTDSLEVVDADLAVDVGDRWALGGWFAANDWSPASDEELFTIQDNSSDSVFIRFYIDTSAGAFAIQEATDTNSISISDSFINGSWHHIFIIGTAGSGSGTYDVYLDGVKSLSVSNVTNNIPTPTSDFRIKFGAVNTTEVNHFAGKMSNLFYAKTNLTDEDILKIYSSRIDLTGSAASVRKEDQIWHVNGRREDGQTEYKLTDQFLLDNSKSGKIYVNFSGDPGDCVDLKLHDGGLGASTVPVRKFDRTYTATPPTTIAHNLPDMPTAFAVLHDDLATGQFIPLNPVDHLKADATNIYTSGFGLLTIDATHPLRIVACVGTPAIGFSSASSSGGFDVIVVDSATTTTYTASHGQEVLVDSDTAATTVNLPATPNVGDRVRARDGSGSAVTNNITVGRNGSLIESVASDHVINLNRTGVDFVYMNAAQGWIMFDL